MRVLDAGTEQLSNADVLRWIRQKREQHQEQDGSRKTSGSQKIPLPKNFLDSLRLHEQALSSAQYPYTSNPSVYSEGGKKGYECMREFDGLVYHQIIRPVLDKYRQEHANGVMTKEQAGKKIEQDQAAKSLTEAELLMIYNHAPIEKEMLLPMIDSVEERFTMEEQEILILIIKQVYRKDEEAAKAAG